MYVSCQACREIKTGLDKRDMPALDRGHGVEVAERLCGRASHVAIKNGWVGLAKIHDNQAVQHIRELTVDIEAQELAADFGILAQKDRQSLAVSFDIGDGFGQLIEVSQGAAHHAAIPAVQ